MMNNTDLLIKSELYEILDRSKADAMILSILDRWGEGGNNKDLLDLCSIYKRARTALKRVIKWDYKNNNLSNIADLL